MSKQIASATRVIIAVGGKSIVATLADSEAARDFASLLPLTVVMNDHFRREKFAPWPRPISEQGKRTNDYAVGTIGFPDPGLIVLGRKVGIEGLDVPGAIEATIELARATV